MPIRPFFLDVDEGDITRFQADAAKILRSGVLILGEYTDRFEKAFAAFIGTRFAVAVNTGSTALEILLSAQKLEGRTVLVPTNTNFATVAAVLRAGGNVRYLDMSAETFAPTLDMVRRTYEAASNIAGLVWVHIGGVISPEFPDVVRYCRANQLFLLEDAAHAHGSSIGGTKSGALADGAAFSFFPTKVMTTSEGGMITTNSEEMANFARSMRNQGKRGMNYGGFHEDFGNSSRMTELHAALGLLQLDKLSTGLQRRQERYRTITKSLRKAGIRYCSTDHMDIASQYKLIVLLPQGRSAADVKAALHEHGVVVGGGVYDLPCHQQPVFKGIGQGEHYPGAETWCPRHICPPLTAGMTAEDATAVADALVKVLG